MNVDEIPFHVDESGKVTKKRKRESDEEDYSFDSRRIKSGEIDDDLEELDEEMISKIVEQAPEVETLDSAGLKKLLLNFEKAYSKNQQMRIKFANDPTKFVESEVDLDEEIKKLQAIAAAPELYPEFIKAKSHLSLLSLVSHENTDISVDAIEVIKELTDGDVYEENPEAVTLLVGELLENQMLEVIVQNLKRLDEKQSLEEKTGVYNTLAIIENLSEIEPETICDALLDKTDFLKWLLKRISEKEFDDVKQYSSELLSILIQLSKRFQIAVGEHNGIEILLTAVAQYKKTNPETPEEEEHVENLINSLCVVAPLEENRKYFTEAEGLHLIRILIKNKKYCRKGALKLLDYVLAHDADNCRRWIDIGGLGVLFGAFMKKGLGKHKKGFDERSDDEHVTASILSLLSELENEEQYMNRILAKFQEKDFEKVERLVDMHLQYYSKTKKVEEEIEKEKKQLEEEGADIEELEEEFYMRKLDGGMFTLQLVDGVMMKICKANKAIRAKAEAILKLNNSESHFNFDE